MSLKNIRKTFLIIYKLLGSLGRRNRIKASIRKNETNLVLFLIKKDDSGFDPNVRESILKIYRELPLPVPPIYEKFKESLSN